LACAIGFAEWDFNKKEYYHFTMPDIYEVKIYESKAKLANPPQHLSLETYEIL
jgi:hypothetical protein